MSGEELVKHQHMVPKLYLRFFSHNDSTLYVFDKFNLRIYPGSIKTIGSERFFYDFNLTSEDKNQIIEKEVNPEYEGSISLFLSDLIRQIHTIKHFTLKLHHKDILGKYIAYQHIRTRRFREEYIRAGTGVELYEPITFDLNPDIEHLGVLVKNSYYVEKIKSILLKDYNWIIAINDTNEKFYTSDHPVAQRESMNSLAEKNDSLSIWDFSDEVSFPLTPDIVLIFIHKQQGEQKHRDQRRLRNKIIRISDIEMVHRLNKMQIERSYRQVYSIDGNYDYVKKLEEERRAKLIELGHDQKKMLLPEWVNNDQVQS